MDLAAPSSSSAPSLTWPPTAGLDGRQGEGKAAPANIDATAPEGGSRAMWRRASLIASAVESRSGVGHAGGFATPGDARSHVDVARLSGLTAADVGLARAARPDRGARLSGRRR